MEEHTDRFYANAVEMVNDEDYANLAMGELNGGNPVRYAFFYGGLSDGDEIVFEYNDQINGITIAELSSVYLDLGRVTVNLTPPSRVLGGRVDAMSPVTISSLEVRFDTSHQARIAFYLKTSFYAKSKVYLAG